MPEPAATVRDRLRYLIALSRNSQSSFAKKTDTDPGYLSRVLTGKQEAGDSFLNRVIINLGVSGEWLRTGRDVPFPRSGAGSRETEPEETPVYDVDVTAGCVPLSRMLTREHVIGSVRLPGLSPLTPLIPVSGDSMEPVIRSGNYVAIREVSVDTISWGYIYVVILEDYRLVKYVRRHPDPGKVILHSANPNYDDMEIRRSDILGLYLVERVIGYDVLC